MLQKLNKFDLDLTRRFRIEPSSQGWWLPAVILAHSGDSWLWATGIGLIWLLNIGGPFWHRFSAILEISIVVQALFVFVLKQLIRRQRPSGEWGSIYRTYDPHSFPSGHATRAVLLAVLAAGIGPAWLGWGMAIWAPLVCVSRIITGLHYVSDVIGGLILGLLMGLLMIAVSPLWVKLLPFLF
jgi:undecaprenyl-diphosphatase